MPFQLLDLGPEELDRELGETFAAWGEKPFRVKQVLRNIYQRGVLEFEAMTDLSLDLRAKLTERYSLQPIALAGESASVDGTVKKLWRLNDGALVESVAIPMEKGHSTFCLSTQTGCSMRCTFCATGKLGPGRNLSAGEIVAQALMMTGGGRAGWTAGPGEDNPAAPNLVFMGMGEPFLNYENLAAALRVLNHNDLMQVGARRITVSTVGLPEGILRFSRDFPQMKLAVSLHAAHERLRRQLMPGAGKVPLESLIEACAEAHRITNKRITFEYLVIPGINDHDEDIASLAALSRRVLCKFNLIPLNPVPGLPYRAPRHEELNRFQEALLKASLCAVTLRKSHGRDIEGACGQLAAGGLELA